VRHFSRPKAHLPPLAPRFGAPNGAGQRRDGLTRKSARRFLVAQNAALNAFDIFKQTPLHAAAAAGAARAVAELANLGAAIGAEDEERLTPLHLAARNGHADVILALLRLGADVEVAPRPPHPVRRYRAEARSGE
jgi:ankyrin repeat protein